MGSLDEIRRSTRDEVERALAEALSRRAELERQLREVDREIELASRWLGRDEGSPRSRTLQDAMALVLAEGGNRGMTPAQLAELVTERGLYRMRDGRPVNAHGIQARVTNYADVFVRDNGLIRLREQPGGVGGR